MSILASFRATQTQNGVAQRASLIFWKSLGFRGKQRSPRKSKKATFHLATPERVARTGGYPLPALLQNERLCTVTGHELARQIPHTNPVLLLVFPHKNGAWLWRIRQARPLAQPQGGFRLRSETNNESLSALSAEFQCSHFLFRFFLFSDSSDSRIRGGDLA